MMKQYTRPTATVVDLAVKENIAALPAAISTLNNVEITSGSIQNVILTTYNLAAASTSDVTQGA